MSDFKVGDRVSSSIHPSWKTGTVKAVRDNGQVLVVQPDGYRYPQGCATNFPGAGTHRARDFTLITPTFRVGDRVKVLTPGKYGVQERLGHGKDAGTVTDIRPSGSVTIHRDGDEWPDFHWLYRADELEPMQSEPTPTGITLRAGDKIRNRITGREGYVYPAPIARMLKVYDAKPPYRDGVPAAAVEEYEFHHPGTYELVLRGQGEVF